MIYKKVLTVEEQNKLRNAIDYAGKVCKGQYNNYLCGISVILDFMYGIEYGQNDCGDIVFYPVQGNEENITIE